jgi:putative NADH-flavin reductase
LDAGHEVVAFARTPSKLDVDDERLSIVQGDVRNAQAVAEAVGGADAVLSVLGPTRNTPAGAIRQGMEHVLEAMRTHGVQRLVAVVGAGVRDPQDRPGLLDKAIGALLRLTARDVYEEMVGVAEHVRGSGLEWTLVRVPVLTDAPGMGEVRVGYLGGEVGVRLSREDLVGFMLDQLEDETYLCQAPVISN